MKIEGKMQVTSNASGSVGFGVYFTLLGPLMCRKVAQLLGCGRSYQELNTLEIRSHNCHCLALGVGAG